MWIAIHPLRPSVHLAEIVETNLPTRQATNDSTEVRLHEMLPTRIGRLAWASGPFLRVRSSSVARHHATLSVRDGAVVLEDASSTGGTLVGSGWARSRRASDLVRVVVGTQHLLNPDDWVWLDVVALVVVDRE